MERSLEADKARTLWFDRQFPECLIKLAVAIYHRHRHIPGIEFAVAGCIAKLRGVKRKKRTPGSKTRYSDHTHLVR
jgi:hypothetical protein